MKFRTPRIWPSIVVYAATCGASLLELRQEDATTGSSDGGCAVTPAAEALGAAFVLPLLLLVFLSAEARRREYGRFRDRPEP
jgi:hypothetical protein